MPKKKPGLYHTKHGQPYRILANGKARFVKKSGAKKRKKKGGSASVGGSARVGGGFFGDVGSAISSIPRNARSAARYYTS